MPKSARCLFLQSLRLLITNGVEAPQRSPQPNRSLSRLRVRAQPGIVHEACNLPISACRNERSTSTPDGASPKAGVRGYFENWLLQWMRSQSTIERRHIPAPCGCSWSHWMWCRLIRIGPTCDSQYLSDLSRIYRFETAQTSGNGCGFYVKWIGQADGLPPRREHVRTIGDPITFCLG
jgi:hypothetical protein